MPVTGGAKRRPVQWHVRRRFTNWIGNDEIFVFSGHDTIGATAIVDTNEAFHLYRIEVAASGAFQVYYDGVLKLTGATYADVADNGSAKRIVWGDVSSSASGASQWLFFRHNAHALGCDRDGDGIPADDDCNDADACTFPGAPELCDGMDNDCDLAVDQGALSAPGVTRGLRLSGDKSSITWTACGAAKYDVVKGDLLSLRATAGNFTSSLLACLEDASMDTASSDGELPAGGFYYLVRSTAACGSGTYDSGASRQVGSRDGEIAASGNRCP